MWIKYSGRLGGVGLEGVGPFMIKCIRFLHIQTFELNKCIRFLHIQTTRSEAITINVISEDSHILVSPVMQCSLKNVE